MIYLLVFLSGVAALIYEVVWSRQLATFLGITTHAHTIVLTSFMAGLALGAWLFGRKADTAPHPLRLFSRLEASIGGLGLATLALVPALQYLYSTVAPENISGWGAQAARLLVAACAVLPAATLMGGTLPVLVRGLQPGGQPLQRTVASLYGANTLGAASGALISGYLLLPVLGVRGSLLVAVALNLTVAALVLLRGRRLIATTTPADTEIRPANIQPARGLLLTGFALSGAAALAMQIAWIRALTQAIGSSVYAFSTTTASYLTGLALGSLAASLATRRLVRRRATLGTAALLEAVLSVTVLAGIPLLGRLPELFLGGYRLGVHESFPRLQIFVFALISAVLIVPTFLLGAILPLVTASTPRSGRETGRGVGLALASNSLGTVVGTLLAGLLLLPLVGARGLLLLAAIASMLAGALLWAACPPASNRPVRAFVGAVAVAAVCMLAYAMPAWDPALMTSGPFINAARFVDVPAGEQLRDWLQQRSRILYNREGAEATVSVRDVGNERLLVINGKTDGSRHGDRKTQITLAHLPLLAHPEPRRVLLVGLGTGMSAAAAAAHPHVARLEIVELSREVVEASDYFRDENEDVLRDPRVDLHLADARNFLLAADRAFDVILSEPSNPWISGVSNLFTREYFELARSRLAPGGIIAQWFQTYGMSESDLRSLLRSFSDVFPSVTVWSPQLGDLLVLGGIEPTRLSLAAFDELRESLRGMAQLQSIGVISPASLARLFLLDDTGVRSFVGNAHANTDDRPRVEFNAPRNLYSETTLQNLTAIIRHLDSRELTVPFADLPSSSSGDSHLGAFGLLIDLAEEGRSARAEWRVNWTTLIGTSDLPSPVGVGNRPIIVLETPQIEAEIELTWRDQRPNGSDLLDALGSRTDESPLAFGGTTLRQGEQAVWLETPSVQGTRAALAWACGPVDGRYPQYLAEGSSAQSAPDEILRILSSSIRCADRPTTVTER